MDSNIAEIVSNVQNLCYAGRMINAVYVETFQRYLSAKKRIFHDGLKDPEFPWMSGFESEQRYQEWYKKAEEQTLHTARSTLGRLERIRIYDLTAEVRSYVKDKVVYPILEKSCDGCFTPQDSFAVSLSMMLPTGKILSIKPNESTNPRYGY